MLSKWGGFHYCTVLGKFTCKCGKAWVSGRAQLNKKTQHTRWQKCIACLEKVHCDDSWIRHPVEKKVITQKIHKAKLCEWCVVYGDCGGIFYQPIIVNDVLGVMIPEQAHCMP